MAKRKRRRTVRAVRNTYGNYQQGLMTSAKNTIGLGVMSGVGMGTIGALGQLMPSTGKNSIGITNTVGSALNLAAVGNLASVGMQVAQLPGQGVRRRVKRRKTKKLYSGW